MWRHGQIASREANALPRSSGKLGSRINGAPSALEYIGQPDYGLRRIAAVLLAGVGMVRLLVGGLLGLNGNRGNVIRIGVAVLLLNLFFASFPAKAEFGDVVMNKRSDIQGVRPVIFSHTFHRIRFRCRACHTEVGFKMRVGSNDVSMFAITDGKFCGACHNGNIAWGPENCNLCHSGRKGLKNGVVGGHETRGPGIW